MKHWSLNKTKRYEGQRVVRPWRKSLHVQKRAPGTGLSFFPQDLTGSELYAQAAGLLHPVVYTTAIILLLSLLAVIISYIYHHR